MSGRDRCQLWVGFIVGSVILGAAGGFVALTSLSRTGILVDLGFMALVGVVIVAVSLRAWRQPGLRCRAAPGSRSRQPAPRIRGT